MKTILPAFALLCLLILGAEAGAAYGDAAGGQVTRLRIAFDGKEAWVIMFDNPVARDFLSLLPLTVTLEDYARTEKIYHLPRKLATGGGQTGSSVQGDFCYYAPWGNLAVFYNGFGHGGGLYILGRIESGKEALGAMKGDFTATIELVE